MAGAGGSGALLLGFDRGGAEEEGCLGGQSPSEAGGSDGERCSFKLSPGRFDGCSRSMSVVRGGSGAVALQIGGTGGGVDKDLFSSAAKRASKGKLKPLKWRECSCSCG